MAESKTSKSQQTPRRKSSASRQQNERAQRIQRQLEEQRRRREIAGVVLIAFGLLLGVFLYIRPEGILSESIPEFLFGLFGFFGYVAPPVFIGVGVYSIAASTKKNETSRALLILGACVCVLSFAHVLVRDRINSSSYLNFVLDSYRQGNSVAIGGGLIGALLSYPLVWLISDVGACILFATGLIIQIVLISNISIKSTGEKVGETIKTNVAVFNEKREIRREEKKMRDDERRKFFDEVSLDEKPSLPNTDSIKKTNKERGFPSKEDNLSIFPPKGTLEQEPSPIRNVRSDGTVKISMPSFQTLDEEQATLPEQDESEEPAFIIDQQDTWDKNLGDYERFLPKRPGSKREMPPQDFPESVVPAVLESIQQEIPLDEKQPVKTPKRVKSATPYTPPPLSLLNLAPKTATREDPAEKVQILEDTLASFGISAKVTGVSQGPTITLFEMQIAPGVRVNRITNLADDIALSLAAPRVRIEAPIPGKSAVGIEVPNRSTSMVPLREILSSSEFNNAASKVCVALGRDISGRIILADLAKMPHLLIAGSTGSGKSVCINCLICSLIYHAAPEDVKLILIDPKVVELAVFGQLPHLLVPVVTDAKKAAGALNWAVSEMMQRYKSFSQKGVRDLARYNEVATAQGQPKMPQIVIIIDELADLMMVAPDDVEDCICRLAQMGRAAGLHLVVATQRPSTDFITGTIKANIPSRIAFAVASSIDSRIILDANGAEKLLGKGDMLFHPIGATQDLRVQGALVTDVEVERIAEYFANQHAGGGIDESIIEEMETATSTHSEESAKADLEDDMLPKAVEVVLMTGQASISMLQRRLRLGYSRAARLIDVMEQRNIISGFDGSKPRKLLIDRAGYERIFGCKPNIPDLGT